MIDESRITFTKHSIDKFRLLESYGFNLKRKQVIDVVLSPERVDVKGNQFLATKSISSEHAIRVVYEIRKGFLVIITFYPVRRERYDL